jgi:hypothetical protein
MAANMGLSQAAHYKFFSAFSHYQSSAMGLRQHQIPYLTQNLARCVLFVQFSNTISYYESHLF